MMDCHEEGKEGDDDDANAERDRSRQPDTPDAVRADCAALIAQPSAEHAAPDRCLDQAIARLRHPGGDRDCDDELRPTTGVVHAPDHEDRPMPKVEAVRASSDLDEWLPPENGPKPVSCRIHDHGDDDHRQDRNDREQPFVDVTCREHRDAHDADQQCQRCPTDRIEAATAPSRR